MTQQIGLYFQKTYNTFIIEPNFTNVFFFFFLFLRKSSLSWAVEIIGGEECHDIHLLFFFNKCMQTFDHDCTYSMNNKRRWTEHWEGVKYCLLYVWSGWLGITEWFFNGQLFFFCWVICLTCGNYYSWCRTLGGDRSWQVRVLWHLQLKMEWTEWLRRKRKNHYFWLKTENWLIIHSAGKPHFFSLRLTYHVAVFCININCFW